MATIEEKITALEAKLKQAKALKQKIEARKKSEESKLKRSEDTRRKILIGAVILSKVTRGEWSKEKLHSLLETELTKAQDRKLFSLPELPTNESSNQFDGEKYGNSKHAT